MLSAVENFGPLVGPAVALSHHPHAATHHLQAIQHHQHPAQRGYAVDIVSATAADATVRVTAALSPPTSVPSAVNITTQAPLTHTQLTQLNTLQALKLHHQIQQQYEQHLTNFLNASSQSSTIAGVTVLPHRPQAPVGALNETDISLAHKQQQQQQEQHHYHLQQQQHMREQQSIGANLTRSSNAPKYMNSARDTTTTMMPLTEFTPPPKLKHEQHTHTLENGQSGPINLVTNASNAYAGNANYQLAANTSSSSNPASIDNSRPSSSSSSVDVENDESMSPVSSNSAQVGRKILDHATLLGGGSAAKQPTYSETSASSAAAAVVAAYQYNYSQIYGGGRPAGLYNAPIIFTAPNPHVSQHIVQHPNAVHGAHVPPAYLGAMGTHSPAISPDESGVYPAEYLKALQNAVAAGVFQAAPPHSTSVFQASPLANSNSTASAGITKSRLRSSAAATMSAPVTVASPPAKGEQRTATTTKLSTGTYLYEKAKRSPPDKPAETEKFFKIPSGKEGSLKHRILTRPASVDKTTTTPGKTPVMRTHNSTSSFKKGSYIELSNGSLRRVEDMRTEDFIQCAERSPYHQLIESTVVKINNNSASNSVVIAFSYDRNQSKVDMEVTTDHPFFVYGQGWASCNPELSLKAYGLKCQRLQVGDICISLTKREPPNINLSNNNKGSNSNKHLYPHEAATTCPTTNETQCLERDLQPLILSENVYTTHLKPASACPPTAQYPILRSPHGTMHFMPPHLITNASIHPAYGATDGYARFSFPTSQAQPSLPMHATHTQHTHDTTAAAASQSQSSLPPSNNTRPEQREQLTSASTSASASERKRRWSAPESFSNSEDDDDDGEAGHYEPPLRQKSAPTAAVSCNYKPYMPTNTPSAVTTATGQFNCDFSTNYK
ncbi:ataxin-1 [Anastrepha obliqua]|uniref:ataxin-1 n=1 Tax=Anastrepha obliqua TaxID=95512 RepID=UPI00240A210F|nr:ataxin-1 [Anastrepha obliqua]XP_054727992.1 ataxin-1 [Anastrepha obliqua]XP_054727993.1 ataxin-1 [Anastrepha obliqua]XP_054727994.1 ataxin-1 [Anastrepha obliqua]